MRARSVRAIKYQYNAFVGMLVLISVLMVSYVYLVNATAFMTADRKFVQEQVTEIASDLSSIEQEYLEKTTSITKELALSLGFEDRSNDVLYVFRANTLTASLIGSNEI